jgi:uncharacterized lipoprotein YbaY
MDRKLAVWVVVAMTSAAVLSAGACRPSDVSGKPSGRATRGAEPARTPEPTIATTSPERTPAVPTPAPVPRVTGEIYLRERVALPAGTLVRIRAVRLDPGGSRTVVASFERAAPKHPPIAFELVCDPDDVAGAAEIDLEAEILRGERAVFRTPAPVPVLIGGHPTLGVKLVLRRVQ